MSVVQSKILRMFSYDCQWPWGLFGQPEKSLLPTKYEHFDRFSTDMSKTTALFKDKKYCSADNSTHSHSFILQSVLMPRHRVSSADGTGPLGRERVNSWDQWAPLFGGEIRLGPEKPPTLGVSGRWPTLSPALTPTQHTLGFMALKFDTEIWPLPKKYLNNKQTWEWA